MYAEYLHMAKHIMQIPHCIPFCLLVLDPDSGCCCARLSAQDCGLSRWLTAARCVSMCVCVSVLQLQLDAVACLQHGIANHWKRNAIILQHLVAIHFRIEFANVGVKCECRQ